MTKWLEKLTGETQTRLLHLLRRSRRSITDLADKLGLTDNAVRTHIAVLRREGIVEDVGTQRDTGGKPARLYGVTREGEELFPKAYAPVLGMMIDEVIRRDGREHAVDLLRAVGALIAANGTRGKDMKQRVHAAAALFEELGADVDVAREGKSWRLQGYGCPLSAVSSDHSEVCELGKAIVAEITGTAVTECCERGEHPRCGFLINA